MSGTWRNCPECGDRRRIVDPASPCIDCRLGITALPDGAWVLRGNVRVFVAAEQWDRNGNDAILAEHAAMARGLASSRREPIKCGTTRGYRNHLNLKEPTCDNCRAAKATETAGYRQAEKARELCGHDTETHPLQGRIWDSPGGAETPNRSLTKSTPEYRHPGELMASANNTHTSAEPASGSLACHTSPLMPGCYCTECGTYNADSDAA